MEKRISYLKKQMKFSQRAIVLNFIAFFVSCCNFDFTQFPGYLFLSVNVSAFALSVIINDELNDQMNRALKGAWYD